jgi:heme A synthase
MFLRTGNGATKGAIIGGAVGAGLLGASLLIYRGLDDAAPREGRTGRIVIGAAGVIGVGALIGGWIGSTHEHWEPVW